MDKVDFVKIAVEYLYISLILYQCYFLDYLKQMDLCLKLRVHQATHPAQMKTSTRVLLEDMVFQEVSQELQFLFFCNIV